MTDDPERPRKKKARPVLTALLVLAILPIGGVVMHAVAPPPLTLLMAREFVSGHGLDYRWRSIDDISPNLVASVIGAEDARFCTHGGFDMEAIEKALKDNESGRRIRGGSTISQQTAKNVFLWPGRDWIRKGFEAGYTLLIETVWSKRRIMEVYLNVAEMGPGVYGAEAAAQYWFDKSASDLTPREAARIASILPRPRVRKADQSSGYARQVQARARVVRNEGLAACVLS